MITDLSNSRPDLLVKRIPVCSACTPATVVSGISHMTRKFFGANFSILAFVSSTTSSLPGRSGKRGERDQLAEKHATNLCVRYRSPSYIFLLGDRASRTVLVLRDLSKDAKHRQQALISASSE